MELVSWSGRDLGRAFDRTLRVAGRMGVVAGLLGSTAAHADGLTISGLVGAGPTYTSNIAGGARYAVDTAPNRPSYLAFNGAESLGGDTAAYFRLSGRFLVDTGNCWDNFSTPMPSSAFAGRLAMCRSA